MNAPAWLPPILAALMLAVAAFTIWRTAMSRVLATAGDAETTSDPTTDLSTAIVVALLALATAGMLVHWMTLLRPGIWAVLLAVAGAWLVSRRAYVTAAGCAIGVYMLLAGVAPSTISGSTAGYYTMAGMPDMYKDTTITYPALGVALSVVLVGYAVVAVDRLSVKLNPVLVCEVVIAVTMAYAILAKLV
jgi:hypothetical protein